MGVTVVGVAVVGAAGIGMLLRRRARASADAHRTLVALRARLEAAEAHAATLDAETRRLACELDRLAVLVRRRAEAHLPQQRSPQQRSPQRRSGDHPQVVSSPPTPRA